MVMPSNQILNYSKFYLKLDMCYNTHCNTVEVPYVREFDLLPKLADIAVLDDPSGKWKPGLYVRFDQKQWRLALEYTDVCNLLLDANRAKVIVMSGTTEVYPEGWRVFNNSQPRLDLTVRPSPYDIWVAVLSESEYIANVVTKPSSATSVNVIQLSNGTDRTIKDWVPTSGGLVSVDSQGRPAIARLDTNVIKGDGSSANPYSVVTATDTVKGIVALNKGTSLPSDLTNDTDALTAGGLKALLDNKPNSLTDAVSKSISVDPNVITGDGTNSNPFSVKVATDTVKGIVALATEDDYSDPTNNVDAVTPSYVEQAVLDAVERAIDATTVTQSLTGTAGDAIPVDSADPEVTLIVNGNDSSVMSIKALRSLGGVHLGHVVIGVS